MSTKLQRRLGRIVLIPTIVLLTLTLVLMIVVQIPAIQTKVAQYVIEELNDSLGTKINVDRISIEFFGDVNLYGVSAEDDYGVEFIEIPRLQAKLSLTGLILEPNRINIRKLNLFEPNIKVVTYKGDSISNFITLINNFSSEEEKEKSDFKLRGVVNVYDGKLLIRNENLEGHKRDWVNAENFQLKVENFRLENDLIWADLKNLSFDGKRNGEIYQLKQLATSFHLSDQEMILDELKIHTEDTDLEGHLFFTFDSQEDLGDFENKVHWNLEFIQGSVVGLKDIRYFVEDFDKDSQFEILGQANGTLNDMVLTYLQLADENTFIGFTEFELKDMTDGEKIALSSNALKMRTNYQDLTRVLPTFIAQNIPDFINRFGNIDYSGDFDLNYDEIKVDGYAITSLGDADLNVNLIDYRSTLKYSGSVNTNNINLKQITDVDELGFISGRLNFVGSGTDLKELVVTADGNLNYIDLLGNRYENVAIDGNLKNERFSGFLSINDDKLSLDYDGLFDFSQKPFRMEFVSDIRKLDLDYLGVTKDLKAKIKTNAKGDFTFSELDDLLGTVELNDVYFTSINDTLSIDYAHIVSSQRNDRNNLELDVPGYLNGEVHGDFYLSELPDAIINSIGSQALVTYQTKEVSPNQRFSFYFEFGQDLLNLFDDRIKIDAGTIIDGYVDVNSNSMIAEMSSTGLAYGGFQVFNPLINIDTSKETEQIYIRSDSLNAQSVMLYNVGIHTTPIQDSLLVKTNFQIGKEFPVDFDLNLFQTINEDQNLVLGFSPSQIVVDGNVWSLNPENNRNSNRAIVNFDTNYYELQNLSLESGDQKLLLDGYFESETNFKLNADLAQLDLSKILSKGLLGDLTIEGIANGDIDIIRTEDELKPLIEMKVSDLALNDYSLGDLNFNGSYNLDENVFDLELFLEQQQVQVLFASGFVDNKPEKPEINMVASLDDLNFKFVESFLTGALSNLRGMVSGNMRFTGPIDSPDFEGMLDLTNLGFKIDFLNTDYSFDGVNTVPVSKQSGVQGYISLDALEFRDTIYGTKGEVFGQLLFRDFATWFLNLSFNTDNLLVLNTNISHNDLFYGKVFGEGAFEIFGPPERLDISASATVNEGSEFTINTGATKVEGENKLVRFIPEDDSEKIEGGPLGMNIDLEITADAGTLVNLIFDPASGDMVTANGSTEKLKFKLNRTGNMSIEGIYTLDYGKYEFRQVPLLNRDFEIAAGSYVSWNGGDPFDANMDITANYERTVSNVGEFLGAGYSQSYDVILGIVISESLSNPQMDFTLTIPKGGADIQSMIDYKFNLDPDDKMIQFGAVLLFGQFMTDTDAVLAKGAASTGAGIALKQLGGIINSMIAGGGVSIGMDYVTGSAMSGTSDTFRGNMKVDLSPRWTFNGAVGVPVGGGYSNEVTTGEAEIEWDISPVMNKTTVVNFFTRPTNFGVQNFGGAGNFQSFGAGITYRTSFDRASEIFENIRKRRENKRNIQLKGLDMNSTDLEENRSNREDFFRSESNDSTELNHITEPEIDSIGNPNVSQVENVKKSSKNSLVRFK